MNQRYQRGFPKGNPLSNALVLVAGALAMAASLVLGFFVFMILAGAFLLLAVVVGVRLWWFRRQVAKAQGAAGKTGGPATGSMIEGEYREVVREEQREKPPES